LVKISLLARGEKLNLTIFGVNTLVLALAKFILVKISLYTVLCLNLASPD